MKMIELVINTTYLFVLVLLLLIKLMLWIEILLLIEIGKVGRKFSDGSCAVAAPNWVATYRIASDMIVAYGVEKVGIGSNYMAYLHLFYFSYKWCCISQWMARKEMLSCMAATTFLPNGCWLLCLQFYIGNDNILLITEPHIPSTLS